MVATHGRSGGDHTSRGTDAFPVDGLPSKPSDMSQAEGVIWDALLDQLPDELLRGVDVYMLEVLCRCINDARLLRQQFEVTADPAIMRLVRSTEAQINKLSALYGLSPADRGRIKFEPEVHDDATEWENSA